MTTAALTFGLAGFGYIGQRHAEVLARLPGARLLTIADPKPEAQQAARDLGYTAFETVEAMLAHTPSLNALCICTPNGEHTRLSLLGLQAGLHVLCEKPMGLELAACQQACQLAQDKGLVLQVVLQNRFSPAAVWFRQAVLSGVAGRTLALTVECNWNRDERYYGQAAWRGSLDQDGGPLYTQFSHFLDLLAWTFGDLTWTTAEFAQLKQPPITAFEDWGRASFSLPDGGRGVLLYTTACPVRNLGSSLTLIGEKGMLKLGGQYMNQLETVQLPGMDTPPELPASPPPNNYGAYQGSAANHHQALTEFVQLIQQGGSSNVPDALRVVNWIEQLYRLRPPFPPRP